MSSRLDEQKIYLDYNGTTPVALEVEAAISISLRDDWGNPSSSHELGKRARENIESARKRVASLVNGHPEGVIFTSGGTESNNMVIRGICQRKHSEKLRRHVITTNVEHDSISMPLKYLQDCDELEVTEIDASNFTFLCDNVLKAIKENTVLITIMAANNETGVIMPIREIGHLLTDVNYKRRKQGLPCVIFHSDGAQIVGKEPVDVQDWHLDCFTIVGHKFYGPRIGALWTRVEIPPLLFGGGCRERPGTENTPMIVGLGAAAELVNTRLAKDRKMMADMRKRLEISLQNLPVSVKVNCAEWPRLVNTCSVSFRVPSHITGLKILSRCQQIVAGVGAACHSGTSTVSRILLNSGVPVSEASSSIRLSFGRGTHFYMIEAITQDLSQAVSSLLWENMDRAS